MSEKVKGEDLVPQLRRAFQQTIITAVGVVPPAQALQLADRLCETWIQELSGLCVQVPAQPKVDTAAIAADWHSGMSCAEIMAKHECSRATAYRCHPNRSRRGKRAVA